MDYKINRPVQAVTVEFTFASPKEAQALLHELKLNTKPTTGWSVQAGTLFDALGDAGYIDREGAEL